MFEQKEFEKGWDFYVSLASSEMAYQSGDSFSKERISEILKAIENLENSINNHPHRNNTQATFQGYVAEEWSAWTFNVNAKAAGSKDYAETLQSNGLGSVDVQLASGKKYSMKSYADGVKSAKAQAILNQDLGEALYKGQERWVPQNQIDEAISEAHRQMLRNIETRPEVSKTYAETENHLTDRIINEEGIESLPADRAMLDEMASKGKKGEFNAEEYGISVESALKLEYILQEALNAGYTAAALTLAFQMAPEIFKCIDYVIKNGELNLEEIKHGGEKIFTSSVEGFLNGAITCALTIMLEKGSLGESIKNVSGTWIGMTTSILLATIKDSIYLALGRISPYEMGFSFIDRVAIGVGFSVIGTRVIGALTRTEIVKVLSGALGQIIGFEVPVIGYLIGSLVGSAIASIYNMGKYKFLSICVDTGFTCFGLVEQNYELPIEYLKRIGVDAVIPDFVESDIVEPDYIKPDWIEPDYNIAETISFYEIKRGIIGVNKIGYILI